MIEPMTEEQNPRENPQRNIPRNLKQYYLGLLTRGERWNKIDDKEAEELLPQHLLFLRKQMEERRYIVAGPVNEEAAYVGRPLRRLIRGSRPGGWLLKYFRSIYPHWQTSPPVIRAAGTIVKTDCGSLC